jgi:hypothetical protein
MIIVTKDANGIRVVNSSTEPVVILYSQEELALLKKMPKEHDIITAAPSTIISDDPQSSFMKWVEAAKYIAKETVKSMSASRPANEADQPILQLATNLIPQPIPQDTSSQEGSPIVKVPLTFAQKHVPPENSGVVDAGVVGTPRPAPVKQYTPKEPTEEVVLTDADMIKLLKVPEKKTNIDKKGGG